MTFKTVSLALALFGATASASAVQLVTNGNFLTQDGNGDYGAGWSITSTAGFEAGDIFQNWYASPYEFDDAPDAVTAFLGYADENTDTISQSINTAGYSSATLTVSFKSDGYDDVTFDFLNLSFGGQQIAAIDVGSDDGVPFSRTVSYDISSLFDGSTKDLGVSVALDDSFESWVWIENVSITATPVPEPASMAVLGLGALAVARRRKTAR